MEWNLTIASREAGRTNLWVLSREGLVASDCALWKFELQMILTKISTVLSSTLGSQNGFEIIKRRFPIKQNQRMQMHIKNRVSAPRVQARQWRGMHSLKGDTSFNKVTRNEFSTFHDVRLELFLRKRQLNSLSICTKLVTVTNNWTAQKKKLEWKLVFACGDRLVGFVINSNSP